MLNSKHICAGQESQLLRHIPELQILTLSKNNKQSASQRALPSTIIMKEGTFHGYSTTQFVFLPPHEYFKDKNFKIYI